MVRVVLKLSPLAKTAAVVAMIGAVLGIYGRMEDVYWAKLAGGVVFFAGVLVYFIERVRMYRNRGKA